MVYEWGHTPNLNMDISEAGHGTDQCVVGIQCSWKAVRDSRPVQLARIVVWSWGNEWKEWKVSVTHGHGRAIDTKVLSWGWNCTAYQGYSRMCIGITFSMHKFPGDTWQLWRSIHTFSWLLWSSVNLEVCIRDDKETKTYQNKSYGLCSVETSIHHCIETSLCTIPHYV